MCLLQGPLPFEIAVILSEVSGEVPDAGAGVVNPPPPSGLTPEPWLRTHRETMLCPLPALRLARGDLFKHSGPRRKTRIKQANGEVFVGLGGFCKGAELLAPSEHLFGCCLSPLWPSTCWVSLGVLRACYAGGGCSELGKGTTAL